MNHIDLTFFNDSSSIHEIKYFPSVSKICMNTPFFMCQTSALITPQRRGFYIATRYLTDNLILNAINVKEHCAYSNISQHWI